MAKRKKKSKKGKETNIGSSSLLPARPVGEKPDMVMVNIKREPPENDVPKSMDLDNPASETCLRPLNPEGRDADISELFSLITETKNKTVIEGDETSNHSVTSTLTEPMETDEGASQLQNHSGNQIVPTSFAQVHVKQEPVDYEVTSNQTDCSTANTNNNIAINGISNVEQSIPNNHLENCSTANTNNNIAINGISNVEQSIPNNHLNVCTNNQNVQIKQEPVEKRISECINEQEITNVVSNATPELINNAKNASEQPNNTHVEKLSGERMVDSEKSLENSAELLINNDSERLQSKRKADLQAKIEIIRKRIKKEPFDSSQSVVASENNDSSVQSAGTEERNTNGMNDISHQVKKGKIDDESMQGAEMVEDDIAVLPIATVQKSVQVVTLSDDDDNQDTEPKNIEMVSNVTESVPIFQTNDCNVQPIQHIAESSIALQSTSSTSPKKIDKQRNFSTEILKYFSVASELDRHDCQSCLEYLSSKYKTTDPLSSFFPLIKKENNKSKQEIKKGDILFKKKVTEKYPEVERVSISPKSYYSNSGQPVDSVSQVIDFPGPSASQPMMFTSHSPSSTISSLFQKQHISTFASSSSSFLTNPSFNQQISAASTLPCILPSTSSTSTSNSSFNSTIFKESTLLSNEKLQEIIKAVLLSSNALFTPNDNNYIAPTDPRKSFPSRDLQLPRRPSVENSTNIPISKYTPLPQVPAQPFTSSPNQDFQQFPAPSISVPNTSSHLSEVPSTPTSSSTVIRDPRLLRKFPPRIGMKDLRLYYNIGRDYISQYFDTLILQWNPSWLLIQQKTASCPPICDTYKSVGYSYPNEMNYYNTYVPLHLLNVWYCIFQSWIQRNSRIITAYVFSVEKLNDSIKIVCYSELENTEEWPKRDDIVLMKYNKEEAFLHVEEVRKRPLVTTTTKLRISLESLHDFKLKLNDQISFCILWNIRTAYLQTEALNSLDNSMKELVLKPTDSDNFIEVVQLDGSKHIKEQRNDVLEVVRLHHIRIVVVETYPGYNNVLFLTQLAYNIWNNERFRNTEPGKKREKILIILKNDVLLDKLYRSLSQYKPVLAIRTKQINLIPELIKYTFDDRLEKKENLNDILNNHYIFISTFSSFGSNEKNHLSKIKDLICIIDDARLCTEVETALPLTLKLRKLILIGSKERSLSLPSILNDYKYHITLFDRLLKAKRKL